MFPPPTDGHGARGADAREENKRRATGLRGGIGNGHNQNGGSVGELVNKRLGWLHFGYECGYFAAFRHCLGICNVIRVRLF